ncbi:uncharacterized protein LOC135198341 isoform X2 [Macrobrachium nipponense]|uniref:uncharacterized protein LOC135198341 isoform X2 n=1 Tax=Macrobrachium nipponense TaxID=159736 RepID=UPI0030C89BEF
MTAINATDVTGRSGYESFDCAQAVALIGFLGLISNFQDIIQTFTQNANGGKRRRSAGGAGILEGLSHMVQREPWEALQPVINMVSWASGKNSDNDLQQEETNNHLLDSNAWINTKDEVLPDEVAAAVAGTGDKKTKGVTPFVNDIAMFGPQLALWVVDVADGRITGEEGRSGVCQTIQKMEDNHGFAGSVFGNLLTQTVVKAMASYSSAENLLEQARLHKNPNPCLGSFATPQTA